jgi:lysophospholipase L1-like esterase
VPSAVTNKTKSFALAFLIIILLSGIVTFFIGAAMSQNTPIRVACVGDSITEGSGYPYKLQLMLGSKYFVANFGVSGSTVSQDSIRPYMNQSAYKQAKDFDPDIVVIMLGTNDANPEIALCEDTFSDDYSQLITSFQQLEGQQLIWIAESPPIYSTTSSWNNTYLSSSVLPQIEDLANQMNLPTINMYDTFADHPDYFADGIHPNADGALLLASTIYYAITTSDGSPDSSVFNEQYIS